MGLRAERNALNSGAGALPRQALHSAAGDAERRRWERRGTRPINEVLSAPRDGSSDDSGPADR